MRNLLLSTIIFILITGCTTNKMYSVNYKVNSYKYSFDGSAGHKTPAEFYKDGGGSCLDFARAKQVELGGEIVLWPDLFRQDGKLVSHAVLKVNGYILDSRTDKIVDASAVKTLPYNGA